MPSGARRAIINRLDEALALARNPPRVELQRGRRQCVAAADIRVRYPGPTTYLTIRGAATAGASVIVFDAQARHGADGAWRKRALLERERMAAAHE